ncbi:hypothetical protein ACLKA6_006335 [Drosophila palustris]
MRHINKFAPKLNTRQHSTRHYMWHVEDVLSARTQLPVVSFRSSQLPNVDARLSAWSQLCVCLYGSQIAVISFNLSQWQRQQQMLPLAAQIVFVWEIETSTQLSVQNAHKKMLLLLLLLSNVAQRLFRQYEVARLLFPASLPTPPLPHSSSPIRSIRPSTTSSAFCVANAQLLFV